MKNRGFTVVELLVMMLIVMILLGLVLPVISNHVVKARRAGAKSVLMDISSKQEAWWVNNKTYAARLADLRYVSPLQIDDRGKAVLPDQAFYAINMVVTSATYSISATPLNRQLEDTACGTLAISHTGAKTAAGTDCW